MPRHPVVNRRNATPLERRSISVTPDAYAAIAALAATLGVSSGSVIDTALRELATRPVAEVVAALATHGHLTPDEHAIVIAELAKGRPTRKGKPQ